MQNDKMEEKQNGQEAYSGNHFGRKHTIAALIIVLLFIGIAVCRYIVIKPEKFFIDPEDPVNMIELQDEKATRG